MTDKEFIKWLRNFIEETGIKNIHMQNRYEPTYNHTTMLKEIADKLEKLDNPYPRTGALSPTGIQ
jgi:hypothetical protein